MSRKISSSNKNVFQNKEISLLVQQGLVFHREGNIKEARKIYEKILGIEPENFDALQLLGVIFAQDKKYLEAIKYLSKALKINPNHVVALSNLGISQKELKLFDEALDSYDKAIAIKPDHIDALINRGNVLQELKRLEEALDSYNKVIAIRALDIEAHYNRGNVLYGLKRLNEALDSYDKAIVIKPDHSEAFYNRGNVLQELKCLKEALDSYDKAIAIKPDNFEAFYNRGNVLQRLKNLEEAKISYEQAIMINSNCADAHWNLSLCNLRMGNFYEGWQGYEWRWKSVSFGSKPLKTNKPSWDFKKTQNRLLLHQEQGVGDQIFFSRFLPNIQENVPNILVQIDRRLVTVLQRSLPKIKFFPSDIKIPDSDYDIYSPIGSIGKFFCNSKMNFLQSKNNFLISDKSRTQNIRNKLATKKKLICGISWKSKSEVTGDDKSLSLEKMAKIFNAKKTCLVDLQYGETAEDINCLKETNDIELVQNESIDNLNDLDGLTSLIDACDFIVSIDNVTIQIASALGKKSFVLLSYFPHWCWPLVKNESTLLPGVKVYRQEKINEWDKSLEHIRNDIKNFNFHESS
jgi:tetratricopeptide (TPR) repeat protein